MTSMKILRLSLFLLFTIQQHQLPRWCCWAADGGFKAVDDGNNSSSTTGSVVLADSLSNQVMYNVFLYIETILDPFVLAVGKVISLRDNHAFPYGMTAPDRSLIFSVIGPSYSQPQSSVGLKMYLYIGLEDGTYFGTSPAMSAYREPGNSGYDISDIKESDPNYKYYVACVNDTNGDPLPCVLQESTPYISCIDDCQPTSCNTTNPNPSITYNCRQYETKVVQANEVGKLGYIPETEYCVNQYYQPEQRNESVVVIVTNDGLGVSLSDCFYNDLTTIVNRTLNGNYAVCGPNKTCDTAYVGGFHSTSYDPRLRPWYIQTKYAQEPTWTNPYLDPYGTKLSISYNQPIYTMQEDANGTMDPNRLLFEGVVGTDYDLHLISAFLKSGQYDYTGKQVFIVEDTAPEYYLIGTSMQRFHFDKIRLGNVTFANVSQDNVMVGNVTDGVTKWVLASNESEWCPYINGSNPYDKSVDNYELSQYCMTIRVSIYDFFDPISRKAFQKYHEQNFQTIPKGIYLKEDDDALGTTAYVAYTGLYTKGNLRWHVFVTSPVPRSTTDALVKGNITFIVMIIVATIGFLTCLIMFYCLYRKRTEKAVIQADWRFTCAFILGCALMNLSSYTLLGENTNQSCTLRMWAFNGLFVSALSPLFVKVWRMAKLLNASVGFRRTIVTNFQAWLYTLPLLLLELLLLTIVTIVDPPRQAEELGVGDGIGYQVIYCSQNSSAFFYIQTIFDGSLVMVGCILAYLTRDLDPKYGEAKQLAFSMYNIAFTGLITILIVSFIDLDQISQIVVQTVSVLWGSCFCSLAFVLPRLLQVQKDRELAAPSSKINPTKSFPAIAAGSTTPASSMKTIELTNGDSYNSFANINSNSNVNYSNRPVSDDSMHHSNLDINDSEHLPKNDAEQNIESHGSKIADSYSMMVMETLEKSLHESYSCSLDDLKPIIALKVNQNALQHDAHKKSENGGLLAIGLSDDDVEPDDRNLISEVLDGKSESKCLLDDSHNNKNINTDQHA